VDEYNIIRLRLTAEMADSSNLVKSLVIKAEDARILFDMCVAYFRAAATLSMAVCVTSPSVSLGFLRSQFMHLSYGGCIITGRLCGGRTLSCTR
jgi:hypothetical protein